MFFTLDPKDIFYIITGISFLGLTLFPFLKTIKVISAPIIFVVFGAVLSILSLDVPIIDVRLGNFETKIFEHFTEIIVIISLAGAGLAIDRPVGKSKWHHTWILLIAVMPITIICIFLFGYWVIGLPFATALVLAAAVSPTDPVLARSVQVDGPNKGEENDVNVSLTSEAGLNDGLAFPFIYLAVAVANAGFFFNPSEISMDWFWYWLGYDLIARVFMGLVIGVLCGYFLSKVVFSKYGDAQQGLKNAGLVLMSSTFLTYGIAEIFDGYGFLSVFIAAITSRALHKSDEEKNYAKLPHEFSDQIEKILVALLLLWLGYYSASSGLIGLTVPEILFAVAIVFLIRPVIAIISLALSRGSTLDKFAISFLGIRGIGSFYYLAYAQNHYEFLEIDSAWRIMIVTVLVSIFVHGVFAPIIMNRISKKRKQA